VGLVVVLLAERFAVVDVPKCRTLSGIVSIGDAVFSQQVGKQALVVAFQRFFRPAPHARAITSTNGISPPSMFRHAPD